MANRWVYVVEYADFYRNKIWVFSSKAKALPHFAAIVEKRNMELEPTGPKTGIVIARAVVETDEPEYDEELTLTKRPLY